MNKIIASLLIIITLSCKTNKQQHKTNNVILELIENNNSSNKNLTLVKKKISLKVEGETIIEPEYKFKITDDFESYSSLINSYPTLHVFDYTKNQKLLVFKNIDLGCNDLKIIELKKADFLKQIQKMKNSEQILTFLNGNVKMSGNRIYDIICSNNIFFLLINFNKNAIRNNIIKAVTQIIKQ